MTGSVLVYSREEISGDGLIKLPFIATVRAAFPKARFSWCVATGRTVYATTLREVVAGAIDEIITEGAVGLRAAHMFAPLLAGRRFDVVIDTQSHLGSTLIVRRLARHTFISPTAGFLFSDRKPDSPWPDDLGDRLHLLAELAAGKALQKAALPIADEAARTAAQHRLPPGPTYVGFAPGAGGTERRWPLERYIELARRQAGRGRIPVFILGPAEAAEAQAIRQGCPEAMLPQNDQGADVAVTVALASRLAAGVANDAGPAHMLAAGGAPMLSLFRQRRKAGKFRPAAPRVEVLIAEDYGAPDMALIPAEDADAALERLLADG